MTTEDAPPFIVPDATLLANAVGDDEQPGSLARSLLRSASVVAIPDLADVETAAVLRKRRLASSLSDARLDEALRALQDLPWRRWPASPLLGRALELRSNMTVHEGVYVALAEAIGAELITADARLAGAPGPRCSIRLIPLGP